MIIMLLGIFMFSKFFVLKEKEIVKSRNFDYVFLKRLDG